MPRTPEDILDELLVLRVQDGEGEALEALTARWQERLMRHALHLTADRDAAADVVQEAWLAAIRGIRRLHDPASFRGWVFRILSNKAADWVRQRSRDRGGRRSSAESGEPAAGQHDPDIEGDALSRAERIEALRRAVRGLPAEHRAVVSLHYGEGLSVGEIGRALDIPPGTVKSRLHHARERLKRMIESKGEHP